MLISDNVNQCKNLSKHQSWNYNWPFPKRHWFTSSIWFKYNPWAQHWNFNSCLVAWKTNHVSTLMSPMHLGKLAVCHFWPTHSWRKCHLRDINNYNISFNSQLLEITSGDTHKQMETTILYMSLSAQTALHGNFDCSAQ